MPREEDPDTLGEKAKKAFTEERYARACILFEKVPLEEQLAESIFQLGKAYLERGRYDQALQALKRALDKGYDPAACLHAMGLCKARTAKDEDAVKDFESALVSNPKHQAALLELGGIHERHGNFDKAIELYQRAIALDGSSIEGCLRLAKLYANRRQLDEVIQPVRLAVAREPENPDLYNWLGDLFPTLPVEEKDELLDALMQTDAPFRSAASLVLWLAAMVRDDALIGRAEVLLIEKAGLLTGHVRLLERALRRIILSFKYRDDTAVPLRAVLDNLASPLLHAAWYAVCVGAGKTHEALGQFKKALQADTTGEHGEQLAGEIGPLLPDGDEDLRAAMAEAAQSLQDPNALLAWAGILRIAQVPDQAIEVLESVSEKVDSPRLSSQFNRIWGQILMEQEKHAAAVPYFLKVLHHDPDDEAAWDALFRAPKNETPKDLLKEASDLLDATTRPVNLVIGARVLASGGSLPSAVRFLEKALRIDAAFSQAYAALGELLPRLDNRDPVVDRIGALVKNTGNATALAEWGNVLDELGRSDEALSLLEAARTLAPDDESPVWRLARLYEKTGLFHRAFDFYREAAELAPESEIFSSWIDSFAEQEKLQGVTARLAEGLGKADLPLPGEIDWEDIRKARDDQLWQLERAVTSMESSCDDKSTFLGCGMSIDSKLPAYARDAAERLYRGGAAGEAPDFYAVFNLGITEANQKLFRKALETFGRIRDPDSPPLERFRAQLQLARCYMATQQFAEAGRAYSEAFEAGTGLNGEHYRDELVGAYNDWAWQLSKMRRFDRSLAASRAALLLKPPDAPSYDSQFRLAYTYGEMPDYDRSIVEYEAAIKIDPTLPHAYHNIAYCCEQQGLYRRARSMWNEACKVYQGKLSERIRDRDAEFCINYGKLLAAMGELRSAESVLRAAELLDPKNADVQCALLDLYLELVKNARLPPGSQKSKRDAKSDQREAFHWRAQNAYQEASQILRRRLTDNSDPQTLLELGALELRKGEYEKATKALKESVGKNPNDASAHQKLGETYLAQGRYKDAIASFGRALFDQPDNLALRTVFGRALLRSGNLDDAESEFLRVTDSAEFHVDAWLGLGEVYLEMAETKTARDSARMDEWYDRAIEAFARGIDIAATLDRPITIASEMDTAHYLLGYARIQQYESSGLLRDSSLVSKAQSDFRKCLTVNPHHAKARRALQRIKEQRGRRRTMTERAGPYLVAFLSFLLMGFALFGLVRGFAISEAGLGIARSSIEGLREVGLSQETIDGLAKQMADTRYSDEKKLLDTARDILGTGASPEVMSAVREGIVTLPPERQYFRVGEFALLVFGGFLFLIAGFYLPQLTRLKLPGLQLDKSASERVEPIRSLGINK